VDSLLNFFFLPPFNLYWYLLQAIALILPLNNVVSALSGAFLILLFLIREVLINKRWRSLDIPINRGWLGLSGWLIITSFTAFFPSIAWTGLFNFLPFFLLFAIAQTIIKTSSQFAHILKLLIISSLLVSGLGILQVIINQPDWKFPRLFSSYEISLSISSDYRIKSLFGHFNELGIYLAMILVVAIGTLGQKLGIIQRCLIFVALGLGLVTIFFSGSRNAIALLGLGIIALAIYHRYWYLVGGLVGSLTIVLWAAWGKFLGIGGEWLRVLFPMGIMNRLESTINSSQGDYGSTADRLNAWKFATELIQARPIQGWGLRSFSLIAKNMGFDLRTLPHEHNFYLTMAVGGGIPFAIAFMLLIGWIIWQGLNADLPKLTKDLVFAAIVAIAIFFLSGLLDVVFYEPRVNILSWILLGGIYGVSSQNYEKLSD
jgi:O-antigen ligase